jgi:hypothetical protein
MDAREAREHLEMVDRILTRVEPPKNYRPWSWALIVIGLAAALIETGAQMNLDGYGPLAIEAGAALMVGGYIYMVWVSFSSRRNAERMPAGEARVGKACSAVWLAVIIAFWAQPHIFGQWAAGAVWNLGGAIQMLMFGFFGDRKSLIGGLLLAFSIPAANYAPEPGYVLAGGFLLGYVIPGVLAVLEKNEQPERG